MKLTLIALMLLGGVVLPPLVRAQDTAAEGADDAATTAAEVDNTKPLPKSAKPPRKLPGGWHLSWNDEFNGSRLDTKKWNYELGVVRNKGCSQAYTKANVKVSGGVLQLISEAKKTPNETYGRKGIAEWAAAIKTQPYASGSVTTLGTKSFTLPGRLEFRARIPKAKGVWPAIWTMHHQNGYGWPANGEIDILEHVSQEPNTIHSVFRWGREGKKQHDAEKTIARQTRIPDLSKEFHTYVLEWDEDTMRILIDDKEVGSIQMDAAKYANGDNPLKSPCYIIMNTAIGGPGTWATTADAPEQYPVTFEIDYVRYYTRSAKGERAGDAADASEGDDDAADSKTTGKKGGKKTAAPAKTPKPKTKKK